MSSKQAHILKQNRFIFVFHVQDNKEALRLLYYSISLNLSLIYLNVEHTNYFSFIV